MGVFRWVGDYRREFGFPSRLFLVDCSKEPYTTYNGGVRYDTGRVFDYTSCFGTVVSSGII